MAPVASCDAKCNRVDVRQAAADRGAQGVAGAGLVDGQIAERRDTVDDGYGQRAAAGIGAHRQRHRIRVIAGHDVAERIDYGHGHGRADRLPGAGVGRLLEEHQVVGRRWCVKDPPLVEAPFP